MDQFKDKLDINIVGRIGIVRILQYNRCSHLVGKNCQN